MRHLLVIAALALASSPARADQMVSARDVGPTQVEIGRYAAGFKLSTWKNEAKAAGVSFESYVNNQLTSKFAGKAIGAIVDPGGKIRMLDGHHKLTALRTIERKMGIKVPVRIKVVHDYKGQSFDSYAKHMVGTLKKGYFGAKPPRGAAAKVRSLPQSFDKMADNPLRSVLGVVFTKSGLEGSWFSDYIQFKLGEKLMASGLGKELARQGLARPDGTLDSNAAGNPKVIKAVTRIVFGDPKLRAYLHRQVKPGKEQAAAKKALRTAARSNQIRKRMNRTRTRTVKSRARTHRNKRARSRRAKRKHLERATRKPRTARR